MKFSSVTFFIHVSSSLPSSCLPYLFIEFYFCLVFWESRHTIFLLHGCTRIWQITMTDHSNIDMLHITCITTHTYFCWIPWFSLGYSRTPLFHSALAHSSHAILLSSTIHWVIMQSDGFHYTYYKQTITNFIHTKS